MNVTSSYTTTPSPHAPRRRCRQVGVELAPSRFALAARALRHHAQGGDDEVGGAPRRRRLSASRLELLLPRECRDAAATADERALAVEEVVPVVDDDDRAAGAEAEGGEGGSSSDGADQAYRTGDWIRLEEHDETGAARTIEFRLGDMFSAFFWAVGVVRLVVPSVRADAFPRDSIVARRRALT